jgi:hypothetical protein
MPWTTFMGGLSEPHSIVVEQLPHLPFVTQWPSIGQCPISRRENTTSNAGVDFRANIIKFSYNPCGASTVYAWRRPCLNLKTSWTIKNLPNGWLSRLWVTLSTSFCGWQMHASTLLKEIIKTNRFVQKNLKVNGNLGSTSFT